MLALGIGATTAIFTLVHSLLLQPLAYPDSGRLVWIWTVPLRASTGLDTLSADDSLEFRERNQSFEKTAGLLRYSWSLTGVAEPQRVFGMHVTRDFFETLEVRPMLGRVFQPEEYRAGHELKVIFSHALWQQRFGADPGLVGRSVILDAIPFEVVGVMPPDFPLAGDYDMWVPLFDGSAYATGRKFRLIQTLGRLKPGVTVKQAQTEADMLAADFELRYPVDHGYGLKLVSFTDQVVGGIRRTLWIFAAAVGCLLLIACSNVASLLLARGAVRMREMAVRAALGASRAVLIRQMLIENTLLALVGGALGYALAVAGVRLLVSIDPRALPRAHEIHADTGVLAFTFLLSLVTGIVFGIVPALRGSRVQLHNALKDGARGGTAGRRGNRFRAALVVTEVALGVVLLAAAGLLARTVQALTSVRPGYDPRSVLTMQIVVPFTRYREMEEQVRFFERLIHQVEELPGVEAAGSTNFLPLGTDTQRTGVWLDTQPVRSQDTRIRVDNRVITPGYFRTMGIPLVTGRFFTWADRANTPRVMIVNDAFAKQFFPEGALGHRVIMDAGVPLVEEVIGVVGSFREAKIAEPPLPEVFTVHAQTTIRGQNLVVRSSRDPAGLAAAIRGAIASLDPDVPIAYLRTMQQQVDDSISQPRMRRALLGVFSVMALILASFGVYGVIACAVVERRQEIGIRMALGAAPAEVRWMVVAQGLKLTSLGLALGLVGAAGVTRLLQGILFGVSAADPITFAGTALVFIAVALVASYWPARQATRVDPLTVLREE